MSESKVIHLKHMNKDVLVESLTCAERLRLLTVGTEGEIAALKRLLKNAGAPLPVKMTDAEVVALARNWLDEAEIEMASFSPEARVMLFAVRDKALDVDTKKRVFESLNDVANAPAVDVDEIMKAVMSISGMMSDSWK